MKNHFLPGLIGVYLLFTSLSLSVTGCGKKGDLVRPVPGEQQQSSQDESSQDESSQDESSQDDLSQDDEQTESSEEALQEDEQTIMKNEK
jgi:predicted small lipoprotein YifL